MLVSTNKIYFICFYLFLYFTCTYYVSDLRPLCRCAHLTAETVAFPCYTCRTGSFKRKNIICLDGAVLISVGHFFPFPPLFWGVCHRGFTQTLKRRHQPSSEPMNFLMCSLSRNSPNKVSPPVKKCILTNAIFLFISSEINLISFMSHLSPHASTIGAHAFAIFSF